MNKKKARKQEKEHAKTVRQGRKLLEKHAREIRIDTLEGLLGMVNEGIVIDAPALVEMIQEVKAATTPVQEAVEIAAKEPGEVGNGSN
jgi:uncharacterized protein (UPF0210 family)